MPVGKDTLNLSSSLIGTIPTITEISMAALLPGAGRQKWFPWAAARSSRAGDRQQVIKHHPGIRLPQEHAGCRSSTVARRPATQAQAEGQGRASRAPNWSVTSQEIDGNSAETTCASPVADGQHAYLFAAGGSHP
jgi:hypothetical protein